MEKSLEIKKGGYVYILILSLLYIVYGTIQLYNGLVAKLIPYLKGNVQFGFSILGTHIPNSFPDVFSGIVLITVGIVLIKAIKLHNNDSEKAFGFLFVGWLLAIVLMILNILVIIADILDTYYPLVWGEKVEKGWKLASDAWGISPYLILGILLLPFYKKMKWVIKEISSVRYKTSLSKK